MRGFLRVILAQAKLYVFLCQSAFAGGFFSRPVVLRDHVVGAAAIRLVFVAGLLGGGDAVTVAGALEVGHVAGRVAVAQLAVAAGAAQTVVGFGGHRETSLFLFSRNGFVDGKRNIGNVFGGFRNSVQDIRGTGCCVFGTIYSEATNGPWDRCGHAGGRRNNGSVLYIGKPLHKK